MKLLVDECVDWRLLRDLSAYEPRTVKQLGWEQLDDGSLLKLAAAEFDAFLTVDKDLPSQQNVGQFDIAVIILRGRTTRLADLRELLEPLYEAIERTRRGAVEVVSWRDTRRS
jgi:predicted nuclease of predicted toxin-antitoxin system